MTATNDSAYQYTKIGADAERAAKKAAEDNLPVDMMNDRRMQSYAGLWAIIGAKAAATVVLAEAREQFEQDIAEAEKRAAAELQRRIDVVLAWHNPVESEYRDAAGNVTRTITECAHCSTLADDGVDWPCATARALGAQSGEVTLP